MGLSPVRDNVRCELNSKLTIFDEGVYFDVAVENTTSLLLALHNAPERMEDSTTISSIDPGKQGSTHHRSFHFHPISSNEGPSPPISLLARVDDQEYILLPKSSSLVAIRSDDLDPSTKHHVRIIAPMTDDHGTGVIQLAGLWLSKGGTLVKVAGSLLNEDYDKQDLLQAETLAIEDHNKLASINQDRKKVLEVITDSPGSFTRRQRGKRNGGASDLMAGVMGWEYLLGEMFEADHVGIGVDGMCLTQDCIGGTGSPSGIGDVFFRRHVLSIRCGYLSDSDLLFSGVYGSSYFEDPWTFSAYVPDVLVSRMCLKLLKSLSQI